MFDTFAILLSSLPSFVFPVFASYKALKSADPALLAPWLMYWVVLAIFLLAESWLGFILFWIPFYGYARLVLHLYLVLPQIQGATFLYQSYVHPWIEDHERAIDNFISSAHERLKALGVTYFQQLIDYVRYELLKQQKPPPPPPAPSSTYGSYAQSLFARFSIPSARGQAPGTGGGSTGVGELYSMLASAVGVGATSSDARPKEPDVSALVPAHVQGSERMSFITAQRERLAILLSVLDREAMSMSDAELARRSVDARGSADRPATDTTTTTTSPGSAMTSRKSEPDFEKIDRDAVVAGHGATTERNGASMASGNAQQTRRKLGERGFSSSSASSWLPWGWNAAAAKEKEKEKQASGGDEDASSSMGRSSGVDT